MVAYEVLFRVKYDSSLIRLSEHYPSIRIYTWCNRIHEVMEVFVEEQSEYKKVFETLSKLAEIIEESSDTQRAHFITSMCYCNLNNSVTMNIEDLNVLQISPVILEDGWEYHRVVVFRHDDVAKMIDGLQKRGFTLEMLKKVPFTGYLSTSLLATDALFSKLTWKQMEAVLKAHDHGYYKIPRMADVKDIANKEKVPRTTFQEHLTKGENKIIDTLIPYIRLYRTR